MTEADTSLYLYLVKVSLSSGACWVVAGLVFLVTGYLTALIGGFWYREWWKHEWNPFLCCWAIFGLLFSGVAAIYISAGETQALLKQIQAGQYVCLFHTGKLSKNTSDRHLRLIQATLVALNELNGLLDSMSAEEVLNILQAEERPLPLDDVFYEDTRPELCRNLVRFCSKQLFDNNEKGVCRLEQLEQCKGNIPFLLRLLASVWLLVISRVAYQAIRLVPLHPNLKPYIS